MRESQKKSIHRKKLKTLFEVKDKLDIELISLAGFYLKKGITPMKALKEIISPFSTKDWVEMSTESKEVVLNSYKLTINN